MSYEFDFTISRTRFDEHYSPSKNTRLTTNFANLARGKARKNNLRAALNMVNNRFNALADWDNPSKERYQVTLDIVSVALSITGSEQRFPSIEILQTSIFDSHTKQTIDGIVGNNFSSFVRDYDFSIRLLDHNKDQPQFSVPADFGDLHGHIFKQFVNSDAYRSTFKKPPVICLSVSDSKIYQRSENHHPILGVEYLANESSLTEQYFKKMGLSVRYFMPVDSAAPFAFYYFGDLLNDYSNLELISTISTMETFQKIYRPEIYNANTRAGQRFKPNLNNPDHSLTQVIYDREERSRLAIEQGKFTQEHFIKPNQNLLSQLAHQ